MSQLYIGIMSGTSMDAIDATLADFSSPSPQIIAQYSLDIPEAIKKNILRLCQPSENELQLMAKIDHQLGHLYAQTVIQLLKQTPYCASDIRAIGNHGQTIRHFPNKQLPYTLQIGDPNILAWQTKINVVADFRRKDIAANGQGAPLVPAFHRSVFHSNRENRVIVNIGGMANISILSTSDNAATTGFDTGPGNILMDLWIHQQRQKPYDKKGNWAKSGQVIEPLLTKMLNDDYFQQAPPKSTGREYFNHDWLEEYLLHHKAAKQADVQATLCELTARTIADAIKQFSIKTTHTYICGGGAYNEWLLSRLQAHLDPITVKSTSELDIDPQTVESLAFAWLAKQTMERKAGNDPKTTGADAPVILGGIYLAG